MMKFNEKLIKLRKEQGLSQEEFGEKLNVTRQTVSKWELGETTPEMSKLLEIANVFQVSVDELTNDTDITKDKNHTEGDSKSTRNVVIIIAIIGVILIAIYMIIGKFIGDGFKFAKGIFDDSKSQVEAIQNQVQGVQGNAGGLFGTVADVMKQTQDEFDKQKTESEKRSFNSGLETWAGTRYNTVIQTIIDKVISSNQKNERQISVKYNDTETSEASELRTLKRKFDKNGEKFEIYFEYDENGFINQVVVEKI